MYNNKNNKSSSSSSSSSSSTSTSTSTSTSSSSSSSSSSSRPSPIINLIYSKSKFLAKKTLTILVGIVNPSTFFFAQVKEVIYGNLRQIREWKETEKKNTTNPYWDVPGS